MLLKWSLVVAFFAISTTVYCIHFIYNNSESSCFETLFACCFVIVGCFVGAVFIDVSRRRISPFHTLRSSFDHYVAITILSWIGFYMRQKLEKNTKNISITQEQFLLQRMSENAETEYGRQYTFSEIRSRNDFVKSHPLTRIDHYVSYIDRMMKGELNILTSQQPVMFAVTSGTSGKCSVLPCTKKHFLFFVHGISVAFDSMLKVFPLNKELLKTMKFFYTPRWRKSESGIPIGPSSSSPTSTKAILNLYSTPKAGLGILSEPEALYVHLLFGLRDKDLGTIEANFSSTVYTAFKSLELHKENLLNDIEYGKINKDLQIDIDVRYELDEILSPDPVRAKEIRDAFSEGTIGLAKRIWPNCELILCCDTGAFELQADKLRETYCKGIPLYSPLYAATEGLIGINIWPDKKPSRYLIVPHTLFYEFIPIENSSKDQPSTLFLDQVKVDSVYEVVITNAGSLYRYRFGDVIRVTSLYNQCPVVEFMYRQGQFLNVRGEKTSEVAFYQALTDGSSSWQGVKVIDYCCAESFSIDGFEDDEKSYTPFYHVFVELDDSEAILSDEDKNMVDESLCRLSYVYASFRNKGSIHSMKLHVVKSGTFQDLRQFTIETTSASSNQYKCPRVLKRKEAIHFVMRRLK